MENKRFFSTSEAAEILGISRVAVFNRIKSGRIKAEKIGRNYIIPKENIGITMGGSLTKQKKSEISAGVAKVVEEYGDTLKMLGKE